MDRLSIKPTTFQRLRERAEREAVSVEMLLERMLEATDDRTPSAPELTASIRRINGSTASAYSDNTDVYRLIAENTSDGICIIDAITTRILYASPSFDRQWGRPVGFTQQLNQDSIYELIHPDDRDEVFNRVRAAIAAHQETLSYTYRGRDGEGRYFCREDHARFIYADDGTHVTTCVISRDITEQRLTEERLRRQNAFLTSLHEITLDTLNRRDINDLLQSIVNHAAAIMDAPYVELVLREGDELIVRTATTNLSFLMGERAPRDEAVLTWQVFDTKQTTVIEDYSTFSGRLPVYKPLNLRAVAFFPITVGQDCLGVLDVSRDTENQPFTAEQIQQGNLFAQLVAILLENARLNDSAMRQLAQRQAAEESLRHSEAYLRSLINSQTAYVIRTDMDGHYTYVNEAFERRFADNLAPHSSWIGKPTVETINPDDIQKTIDTVNACLNTPGKTVQVILRKPLANDTQVWTLWEFLALTDAHGIPEEIQCVGIDISELMQAREQLQLQENALQAAANAILIASANGIIEWANPAFTKLTGYTLDEARGKRTNLLKSGFQDESFYRELWSVVLSGQVWQGRLINRRKDGSLYTEEQTITPVRDDRGDIRHFIAIKQDITERVQTEKIRLEQERLRASLKKEQEFNALIQRAVSALSHDARTPLSVIATARDLLDRYFDRIDEEKRREKLYSIDKQLRYVLQILNDMSLTVKGTLDQRAFQPQQVNLAALCQVTVNEIAESMGYTHRMRFVSDGSIQTARVDETLVSRILLNLLSNAVKYSPENSEVRLELSSNQTHILLRVIDHGMGISEADLPHIFESFYRADAVRQISGTGLGLNIVKECVERHHGVISVQTEVGSGTTFTVELPICEE
ncbi:MAG: PAS domain S-box protein [Anaerolineae bacterium]